MRVALSEEQQVGLIGELMVLLALAHADGPQNALAAWRGPLGEEHDFGTHAFDLEVKTTRGEKRDHWISGATQLEPTADRPLYLVSIQITTAAASTGHTLPSLVAAARHTFHTEVAKLDHLLGRAGFRDRDSDMYKHRWAQRTAPAFFAIDGAFPSITRERIDAHVPASPYVVDIRYRLDLTGYGPSPSLFTVDIAGDAKERP